MKCCYKCGSQIRDDAVFCTVCGAHQEKRPENTLNQNRNHSRLLIGLIVVIVLLLIAVCLLGFFFVKNDEPDKTASAVETTTTEVEKTTTTEEEEQTVNKKEPATETTETMETTEASRKDGPRSEEKDWTQAYAKMIDELDVDVSLYSLLYVNNDEIPELLLGTDSGNSTQLYTFDEENGVTNLYNSSHSYMEIQYGERKGFICIPGFFNEPNYYFMENGELSLYACVKTDDSERYFVGDHEVSQDEFYKVIYKTGCAMSVTMYDTYEAAIASLQ